MIYIKPVKFIKNYSPYKIGDIAGLSEIEADDLAKKGIIEQYKNGNGKKPEKKTDLIEEKSLDVAPFDKMVDKPAKKK